MKTRIEYRDTFNVFGYTSPLINEISQTKEVTLLREKYESKLKTILGDGNNLYFVIWFVDEQNWFYHFGVTKWDNFTKENATCVEVPAGYYIVGKVTADIPALEAWEQLMKIELNLENNVPVVEIIEQETRKYFECYIDNDGNYEIWAPIVDNNATKE